MKKTKWVTCPACLNEWSKLRPCFFLDDLGSKATNFICVTCAETLVSFKWVTDQYPAFDCSIEVKWAGPKKITVKLGSEESHPLSVGDPIPVRYQEIEIPKNAYAVIECNGLNFIATSEGTGKPLQFKESKDSNITFADNVFSLWSKIKHRINDPIEHEKENINRIESLIRKRRTK